jgi:hypothetical protein
MTCWVATHSAFTGSRCLQHDCETREQGYITAAAVRVCSC